jgi:hypothetical protein
MKVMRCLKRAEDQRHQVPMRHDDRGACWLGKERINHCTPTDHGCPTRFPTRPRQIEIRKRLAERLTPMRQRFGGEHPFDETGIGFDGETQPLGEWS